MALKEECPAIITFRLLLKFSKILCFNHVTLFFSLIQVLQMNRTPLGNHNDNVTPKNKVLFANSSYNYYALSLIYLELMYRKQDTTRF